MATWHQMKRPSKLYHDTLWTVVSDPPNALTTCTLFETEKDAREYSARVPHSYILRPAKESEVR